MLTDDNLKALIEGIIYVAPEPVPIEAILKVLEGEERDRVKAKLDELIADYQQNQHGIQIRQVASGYKFSTKAEHHETLRKFVKSLKPAVRLSKPALETLAVIAYRQPVTLPEIEAIRGVDVGGVIHTLMEKKLVTTAGRKAVVGRPILYRTSRDFLVHFGLKDVGELPSLKEFEELAKRALGDEMPSEGQQPESEVRSPESEAGTAPEANPEEAGTPPGDGVPSDAGAPAVEAAPIETGEPLATAAEAVPSDPVESAAETAPPESGTPPAPAAETEVPVTEAPPAPSGEVEPEPPQELPEAQAEESPAAPAAEAVAEAAPPETTGEVETAELEAETAAAEAGPASEQESAETTDDASADEPMLSREEQLAAAVDETTGQDAPAADPENPEAEKSGTAD